MSDRSCRKVIATNNRIVNKTALLIHHQLSKAINYGYAEACEIVQIDKFVS